MCQKSFGVSSRYTVKQLESIDRLVHNRGRGYSDDGDDGETDVVLQPNTRDVQRVIVATNDMLAPSDIRSFVNPYSGDKCVARVIYVLLSAHFHGRMLPSHLATHIGAMFCVDHMEPQPVLSEAEAAVSSVVRVASPSAVGGSNLTGSDIQPGEAVPEAHPK